MSPKIWNAFLTRFILVHTRIMGIHSLCSEGNDLDQLPPLSTPSINVSPSLDGHSSSSSSNFVACSRGDLGPRYTQRKFKVVLFIAIVDVRKGCTLMFELDVSLCTRGRFYKREGSTFSAFSIFTKNVVVINSDFSIVYVAMQPCFGYGYYVGLLNLHGCN